jgi:kojibiose phosphorylase
MLDPISRDDASTERERISGTALITAHRPELEHPFRLVAFDWDWTAATPRSTDPARIGRLIDALLGIGVRVMIVTATRFEAVARDIEAMVRPQHRRRLFAGTNRGSEVFGFDFRGAPVTLLRRVATPEEERLLDAVASEVRTRLSRLSGLSFEIVSSSPNRRQIDLIPEAACAEPPMGVIGELLGAVEARLRGGGLRHGLREAFELTTRVAQDLGLSGARVTSDVKHVEVGLTDKSDSMAYLFREIAAPLGIAPEDVLIAGDEFGPIAGFEGSDHRLLGIPEACGAVVISVGPEPGGAPESVLHLGGGPDRFGDVLEHQLALDARLGPFAPPRDPLWAVEEAGFDAAREHEIESLLSISNGYLGVRGSIAEGSSVSRPATFLAGAFEPSGDATGVPELVIAPDWGRLRFEIEGAPFTVEGTAMTHHRRILDMRRALLLREGLGAGPGGHTTMLRTVHLASLANRHLLLEAVELSPQNFSGTVRVDAILCGNVKSGSGAAHWASFEPRANDSGPMLIGTTRAGLLLSLASRTTVASPEGGELVCERQIGPRQAVERGTLHVELARPSVLHRTVGIFTSRDAGDPVERAEALHKEAACVPFDALLAQHQDAWLERWRRADVEIDGAPSIERALRFALYHLIATVNPDDPRCSVGARALSGEAYRGHVFWDTEIFMLPFYTHCFPEAARALLAYRHRTLDGARRKAKRFGYEGALYAWESADSGDETTPDMVISPFGEIVPVLSGREEQHISADVAYAVWAYARATNDLAFLREEGMEILVETARFWASRVRPGEDGLFHIDRVIGPDEYHESIDDNAFTNWMARFNLRCAVATATAVGQAKARLMGVTAEELSRWEDVARRMYLGHDAATGLIEQFAGYHGLEYVDVAAYSPRTVPLDALLGRHRTQRSQVVKQSDVVQLLALLWDEVSPEARRANFLYYEPRTAHGSSLSPGIHALVAARLGLFDTAARYLEQTASIDLGNNMGNAAGGVHAAGMGSLWQAVVFGIVGLRYAPDDSDTLIIDPHLLPGFRHVRVPFGWRGRSLILDVLPDAIEAEMIEGTTPAILRAGGDDGAPREVRVTPGRRWAARRQGAAFSSWEEISW